ncbi:MAG: hypothetical protein LBJ82_05660 [Deltaproteobacteria bacterium]|jgi:lipoate-protein ligase A|nr:hypothetical protein [Deltaproteobacteria bacterium]
MLKLQSASADAAFYFSMEEYLLRHFSGEEPLLMLWRTGPCVMLGASQIAAAELDLELAERLGLALVRRPSGGGAIFTDAGVLQISLISAPDERPGLRERAFESLAGLLLEALTSLGFPVRLEGRNDILLGNGKCAGLAQHIWRKRICTHGSILYQADISAMSRVLRADEAKIASKGVRSLRARVANLADFPASPWTMDQFQAALSSFLGERLRPRLFVPDAEALAVVEGIRREKYAHPDWTIGRSPPFTLRNSRRFPAGRLEVFLDVRKGRLLSCALRGDFLGLAPIRELELELEGRPYTPEALRAALSGLDLGLFLGDIAQDQLLACLFP